MTESFLTTDIIVIVVLVVVLVLVGVCAFLTHCYWTRIGVSEIWNTPKWSSMRSSFYRTVRRFSRASSSKLGSERPFSPASVFSEDLDGSALPAPLRKKNANNPATSKAVVESPRNPTPNTPSGNNAVRRNSSNQIQPVTTISYNHSVKVKNPESNRGTPASSAQVHKSSETDDPSVVIHTRRL